MAMFRFALLLFFCLMVLVAADFTWSSCASPDAKAKVQTVTLNPDPIVRGQDVAVELYGELEEIVTGGTAKISISYMGFEVYSRQENNCDVLDCPIHSGPLNASFTVEGSAIPSYAPAGQYTGRSVIQDQNGEELVCLDLSFSLPSKSFASFGLGSFLPMMLGNA